MTADNGGLAWFPLDFFFLKASVSPLLSPIFLHSNEPKT